MREETIQTPLTFMDNYYNSFSFSFNSKIIDTQKIFAIGASGWMHIHEKFISSLR